MSLVEDKNFEIIKDEKTSVEIIDHTFEDKNIDAVAKVSCHQKKELGEDSIADVKEDELCFDENLTKDEEKNGESTEEIDIAKIELTNSSENDESYVRTGLDYGDGSDNLEHCDLDNEKKIYTEHRERNEENVKLSATGNKRKGLKKSLLKFRIKRENHFNTTLANVADAEELPTTYVDDFNNEGSPGDDLVDDEIPPDMMETSPIECEVQIKTEPGDNDITVDPGLYNGHIGQEEIFPGLHVMPRPPFVYDPDDTYRKAKKLELEKLQVEKAPRHACPHCDRIFYLLSKLKKHMQSHLEERPYPCPVCGSSHKTDYDLKSHLITHSNQRPYTCPECPASFKRPSSLKSHLHVHSPIRSFACNECQANFKRKSDLLSHMPLHSEVRPFQCEHCAALFKTEKGLKCHVKTHDSRPMAMRRRPRNTSVELARISELVSNDPSMTPGKDRYVCNQCFVEFNKRETLIKHMLVHSSVREFSCAQCSKTFKRRADLRSHMTVHSDYKPYSCQHCTATFKRTIEVKFHMRVHASPVQYTCTACSIVFKSKVQLSRHRSTVHKQPNYRNHCTMCEHSFRTKPELNQHLLEHCQRLQEMKQEADQS